MEKSGLIKKIALTTSLCILSSLLTLLICKNSNSCSKKDQGKTSAATPVENQTQTTVKIENVEDIEKELSEIKDELAKIRAEQRGVNQILGAATSGSISDFMDALNNLKEQTSTPSPTLSNYPNAVGYLKMDSSRFITVDIYQSASFSSTVIAQMEKTRSYPYFEKKDNWYQIELPDKKRGYVNAKFVIEETIRTP